MNRPQLEAYIAEAYHVAKDCPWVRYPSFAVFRHSTQKCFALLMDLPPSRLGLPGEGLLGAVNLKCSPLLIGSLVTQPGIFPAYHMNKEHWVTVVLDGRVPEDTLKLLVDMSYEATAPKKGRPHP